MNMAKRLLREPLVHFIAIGGLLFVLYTVVSGPAPAPRNRIVIEAERISQLVDSFEAARRRLPTEDELLALIEGFIREEVYYREALALGLDGDDTIIRRRLHQKLEFLTDSGADLIEPAAGELEAYYEANARKYQDPPSIAFEQIFLGDTPTPERIASPLAALRSDPGADPFQLGEPTFLPESMSLSAPDAIDRRFGTGFFSVLEGLPAGVWTGPVESGFGFHVVRINDAVPPSVPALDDVRDEVLLDWRAEKASLLRDQVYARFRERYEIVFPGTAAVSEQ
jgi:hypothetical protein